MYNEVKEKFSSLKKFEWKFVNEEQFNTICELPFVIVWNNGKSGTTKGKWYSAYLVKPSYKKSFDCEPLQSEIEDEFDFYYTE